MSTKLFIPQKLRPWVEARKRFHLSDAQVQMARELGMNPSRLGKINNHKQEPWKLPLPFFIEALYFKRFGKEQPDYARSIEDKLAEKKAKTSAKLETEQPPSDPETNFPF